MDDKNELLLSVMEMIGSASAADETGIGRILSAHPELASMQDRDGYTLLHLAAMCNNVACVKLLLDSNGPGIIAVRDRRSRNPLHRSAEKGHTEIAKLLLSSLADNDTLLHSAMNAQDDWGNTPLHYSSYNGHCAVSQLLLNAGADVKLKDKNGKDPLFWGFGMPASSGSTKRACSCPHPHTSR